MEMKTVSIISPVYNGERYIGRYLQSVLCQTYPSIELILVDDGSTDGTEKVIQGFQEKFEERGYSLAFRKQPENKGQAAAINVGLKLFTGTYMMWMDSDDVFYPEAIEKKTAFLEAHPECDFVLSEGEIVSEKDLDKPIDYMRRVEPTGEDHLFRDLLDENNVVFTPGTIFVRADVIRKAIPDLTIYESREGQNWQMLLPLAYSFKCGYLKEALFKYLVRDDSHCHQERTYEQEITRTDNFKTLIWETIDRIPEMDDGEKRYWKEYVKKRNLYLQYCISNQHGQYRQSWKIWRTLRKAYGASLPWDDRLEIVLLRQLLNRLGIKTNLRRTLNKKTGTGKEEKEV